MAGKLRDRLIARRASFVYETVFSHPSKVDFIRQARSAGFTVWMTFINVSTEELASARVGQRIREGGHPVPPDRIWARYRRLQANVVSAIPHLHKLIVVDNSRERYAFVDVLRFTDGELTWRTSRLPGWAASLFADRLPGG